jgi:glycosyltransferase involved in cell wall biosynthesis
MKSVSVVIPSFNSIRTIENCLKSIRDQDYDQNIVQILIADGGSTDGTVSVIKKYKGILIKESSGNPETAKATALKKARGELVLLMATDNVLPNTDWLKTMVGCLIKEPKAVAAYPWKYAHRKTDSSLNRYFALMGVNDPVAWWLNKADRQGYRSNHWHLSGDVLDKGQYFLVKFNKDNTPTLGDNGVLVWRDKLLKAQIDEKHFSHIDVFYDLVNQGLDSFVVVKNEIVHDTGEKFVKFLIKRFKYMRNLYFKQQTIRRYKWVETWQEKVSIALYILYGLTLIGPLITALRGYRSKPDIAWFWHPVVCLSMLFVYTLSMIL